MTLSDLRDPVVGVVDDMPEHEYHAHPALSSSGARKLLPPSCPATFAWEREHGSEHKAVFDLGSAAHRLVLGDGPDLRVIDAPDWRSKAARDQRDEARAAGETPVLAHEHEQVQAMAAALGDHPVARQLFADGRPEVSIFWRDARSGVDCRARLDWLTTNVLGEPVIVDYKTCVSADPRQLQRSVLSYGYHVQQAWYLDGVDATGLADGAGFLFVCQEKSPPYPVTVLALDADLVRIGAAKARQARSIFAHCQATGEWPGHADQIVRVAAPAWVREEDA